MIYVTKEDGIGELPISNHLHGRLEYIGIRTVQQLLDFPEERWQKVSSFGKKAVEEVTALVNELRSGEGELQLVTEKPKETKKQHMGYEGPLWNRSLDEIQLSVRACNCLKTAGIKTLRDLAQLTEDELLEIRNMGQKTAKEIMSIISELRKSENGEVAEEVPQMNETCAGSVWDRPLDEIQLSVRAVNCLKTAGIKTIRDLAQLTEDELLNIRNMGQKTAKEIKEIISQLMEAESLETTAPKETYEGPFWDRSVEEIQLSVRAINCLKTAKIKTLRDLAQLTEDELLGMRNMGQKTAQEIMSIISGLRGNVMAECTLSPALDALINDCEACGVISRSVAFDLLAEIQKEHPDCGTETTVYFFFEKKRARGGLKSRIITALEDSPEGMSAEQLARKLPGALSNTTIVEEVLLELENERNVRETDGTYTRRYPSVLDFAKNLSDEKERTIMTMRLEGHTLAEAGTQLGMTRERARQICDKVLRKAPQFEENVYRPLFEQFNFSRKEFLDIFSQPEHVYHYLSMVCKVKEKDKRPIRDILTAEDIPVPMKRKVEKYYYLTVDGVRLPKSKRELLRYVVKTTCREKTSCEDVFFVYNALLAEQNLDDDQRLAMESSAYLENYLQTCDYVLWNLNHMLRYYNLSERDYGELVSTLDLEQYMDKEISSLKLFRDNRELMRDYDIRDEFELYSLLRKIWDKWGSCDVVFPKMPTLRVGNVDRESQVLELMLQYAPISQPELVQRYEEHYGTNAGTVQANYLACLDNYYYQGIYSAKQESMSREQFQRMSEVLTEDFYMLSDIQRIFQREFPHAKKSLVNAYNLKTLGFHVNINYAVSKKYANATEYFRFLLLTEDVVDTRDFPAAMTVLGPYTWLLKELRDSREIVEFTPRQYINIRRLNACGITVGDMEDFCAEVEKFVEKDSYFTIMSIRQEGFAHKLDELYFDEWFYGSVLMADHERFNSRRMGGTRLLYSGQKDIQQSQFLEWILEREERMELDDLVELMLDHYGITAKRTDLLETIRDTKLYYDAIMDTVYIDYDTYFEEI